MRRKRPEKGGKKDKRSDDDSEWTSSDEEDDSPSFTNPKMERRQSKACKSSACLSPRFSCGVLLGILFGVILSSYWNDCVTIVLADRKRERAAVSRTVMSVLFDRAQSQKRTVHGLPSTGGSHRVAWITPIMTTQLADTAQLNHDILRYVESGYRDFRETRKDQVVFSSSKAEGINEQFFRMQQEIWATSKSWWLQVHVDRLKATIFERANDFLARIGKVDIDTSQYEVFLWATACEACIAHAPHVHENSILSGVYYINAPRGSGSLMFEDPRGGLPPFGGRIVHEPRAGEIVIFPPWLQHHVGSSCIEPSELRVSLSFNIIGEWTVTSDITLKVSTPPGA